MSNRNFDEVLKQVKEFPSKYQRKLFRQLKKLIKKGGKKRKVNPALLKEHRCSKELQAVIGKKKVSRGKSLKYVWVYIKKHKLQSKKNGRIIEPDKKLAAVIGKKPIEMTQLAGKLFGHLSTSSKD